MHWQGSHLTEVPPVGAIGGWMIRASRVCFVLSAALMMLAPTRAEAVSYTFSSCMTANWGGCSDLPDQMKVEVTDPGGGYVDFTFTNEIGIRSSITALYFDVASGLVTSLAIQYESSGVDFKTTNVSPPNIPGGNNITPTFSVSSDLAADTQNVQNGIDALGESLTLRFTLATGTDFADIIAALNEGTDTDAFRIAAHIQALPGGKSDSLICCSGDGGGGTPSPEPASMALMGLLAMGAAYRVRRQRLKLS